jgi:hypothetical protein
VYSIPWSKNSIDFTTYKHVHGSASCKRDNQVGGISILYIDTTDTYVGQSVNLRRRINDHLQGTVTTTKIVLGIMKEKISGTIETCVVDKYMRTFLLKEHNINFSDFLDILEQYLILRTQPTLNKLYVVRHGGNLNFNGISTLRRPLYIYKVVDEYVKVLLYVFENIDAAGTMLGISPTFFHTILNRNGFFRGVLYCTTTVV